MTRLVGTVVCTLALLPACEGTEVGNPFEESPLALALRSSSGDVFVGDEAGAGTRIDEAWVVLGDLRFVLDEECASDRDTRVTVRGPTIAELAQGPDLLDALLQDGAYCRIRIPLDRAGVGGGPPDASLDDDGGTGEPADLEGHSVLVRGRRADGVRFTLRSRLKRELDLRTRGEPFVIDEGRRALILAFDAATWLEGVELDTVAPGLSGAIEIDENHGRSMLTRFEANLVHSLTLFRDQDGDGVLDPSELGDELAAAP